MPLGFVTIALASFVPSLALAHTGASDTSGFIHGFSHPFFGLDHVLVIVGIGIFAAHLSGRALWLVPMTFVIMVAVDGALGVHREITLPRAWRP